MNPSPLSLQLKPWLFQVDPYPEESFSHFLGRFRRANRLSSAHLSAILGLRSHIVSYWESPSRQRRPDKAHLEQLSRLTGIDVTRFQVMRGSPGTSHHWPTRLCAQCYVTEPWHKLTWQRANQAYCQVHQRQLLSECPQCHYPFRLPSYWATGECDRCLLPFAKMKSYQAVTQKSKVSI